MQFKIHTRYPIKVHSFNYFTNISVLEKDGQDVSASSEQNPSQTDWWAGEHVPEVEFTTNRFYEAEKIIGWYTTHQRYSN